MTNQQLQLIENLRHALRRPDARRRRGVAQPQQIGADVGTEGSQRLAVVSGAGQQPPQHRGWKFRRGEQPGAEAAGFDDSGWEAAAVTAVNRPLTAPHTSAAATIPVHRMPIVMPPPPLRTVYAPL